MSECSGYGWENCAYVDAERVGDGVDLIYEDTLPTALNIADAGAGNTERDGQLILLLVLGNSRFPNPCTDKDADSAAFSEIGKWTSQRHRQDNSESRHLMSSATYSLQCYFISLHAQ